MESAFVSGYASVLKVNFCADPFMVGIGISREGFSMDTQYWQHQIEEYWTLMNVNKTDIRNVMDMNALWGGFAAALNPYPVWVMNVVPSSSENTLSAIYDRGLIGAFHDW